MSRIGKLPIKIPEKVKVTLDGTAAIKVEGPKGKMRVPFNPHVKVAVKDGQVTVTRSDEERLARSLHGLTRTLINNAIKGVTVGYEEILEISGVGFKAEVKGKILNMALGFSHPVDFPIPEGITVEVEKGTRVTLKGVDKHLVGMTAAQIRVIRKTEPYKGKGIKYAGEKVRRKVGKQGAV
ncbi:MAG: 50S ribosomal protein L6 [Deltaproteobacteria bacterium]|nr:50S ribosomal protein L6 [Deltaproteobacteria bacterium]